MLGVMIDYGMF